MLEEGHIFGLQFYLYYLEVCSGNIVALAQFIISYQSIHQDTSITVQTIMGHQALRMRVYLLNIEV
jgi:hypothetical protein